MRKKVSLYENSVEPQINDFVLFQPLRSSTVKKGKIISINGNEIVITISTSVAEVKLLHRPYFSEVHS